jgi:molybdopterin synthase sulfur carrier subunit
MMVGGRRGTMGYVVTVRYFAAARAAAGLTEERTESQTLADLVARLSADHGDGLARVLGVASFLVDGVVWHDRDAALPAGATVDVLPPFAGG